MKHDKKYHTTFTKVKRELVYYHHTSVSIAAGLSHGAIWHWLNNRHLPKKRIYTPLPIY